MSSAALAEPGPSMPKGLKSQSTMPLPSSIVRQA